MAQDTTKRECSSPEKDAATHVEQLVKRHRRLINGKVQLTDSARKKILTRLKTYSIEELEQAQDNFSKNEWRMNHNRDRPLSWFYRSDEQVETFLLLESAQKSDPTEESSDNIPAFQTFKAPERRNGNGSCIALQPRS